MRRILLFAIAALFSVSLRAQVISQVYGGGGNAGAPYQNDFIEIFNNTNASINLSGYSVQYAGATSVNGSFNVVANLSGTLLVGQYYLIQANGGSTGAALPTPDATGTTNLSANDGKVILVNSTTAVAIGSNGCPNPATGVIITDFVGYGSANCFEGTGAAPGPNNNQRSVLRNANGCQDNNNNNTNFTQTANNVNPRNTASQRWNCISGAPLPVKFANLRAVKKGTAVSVQFSNLTEEDIASYIIERSAPGRGYVEVGRLSPLKNNNTEVNYTWEDKAPQAGVNLYRIKAVETTGKQIISGVLKVDLLATGTSLQVVPNPVRGQTLGLQVSNLPAGVYQVRIFGANAQAISSHSVQHTGGSLTQNIPLRGLQPGQYVIRLEGAVQMQQSFLLQQ